MTGGFRTWGAPALTCVILALFYIRADQSVADKGPTFDEMAHLTAGYSYWVTGDYRLNPENGRLPQQWDAFPLTRYNPRLSVEDGTAWRRAEVFPIGYRFFYEEGNDLARMLRSGRRANLVFAVLLGGVVFAWSARLFGPAGGLMSVVLFVLDPNVIAHGRLITSDMAAALLFLATVGAAAWCIERPGAGRVVALAGTLSALALTKFSWGLTLPMIAVLIAIRSVSAAPLRTGDHGLGGASGLRKSLVLGAVMLVVGVLAWTGVWAAYGFRYASLGSLGSVYAWSEILPHLGRAGHVLRVAVEHRWLPEPYLWGMGFVLQHAQERATFLLGSYSTQGWWYYFPLAFSMKTPLATLVLLGATGAYGAVRAADLSVEARAGWAARWLRRLAPLLVLIVLYWAAVVVASLNIGVRHLLPTYGAMYILAGGCVRWRFKLPRRLFWLAVGLLVGGATLESLAIHPHYLAFFNIAAGGPSHGYTRLVDSNLDWGQDLPLLARRLEAADIRGTRAYLSYFGTGKPAHYGVEAEELPGFFDLRRTRPQRELSAGIYCVSATNVQGVTNPLPELRGSWTSEHEAKFRRLHQAVQDAARRSSGLSAIRPASWRVYEAFRFGRLMSYLRSRRPDETVGYSILLYRLTAEEVVQALEGPLPELADTDEPNP